MKYSINKFVNFLLEETKELTLNQSQAEKLATVLSSIGIDPTGVIQQVEEINEVDDDVLVNKKPKLVVEISSEAIEAAKKFYQIGEKSGDWYFNAAKILKAGIPNEQERNLFALLLAATSVQNAIYINFIEAALMFNAIHKDANENRELLYKFIRDTNSHGFTTEKILQTEYKNLNIYKEAIEAKVINLNAKMPNIARILRMFFSNMLTKQFVVRAISKSINLNTKQSFNSKKPLMRKLKIANYALTLVDPDFAKSDTNWFNVVVDTWMFRVFYPGADSAKVAKLFANERAYANVSRVISDLAAQAGVSPHVMQAAIWVGIKKEWEGDKSYGEISNYIAAIDKLINDYGKLWSDIEKETKQLRAIISKIDTGIAKSAIQQVRADTARERFTGKKKSQ